MPSRNGDLFYHGVKGEKYRFYWSGKNKVINQREVEIVMHNSLCVLYFKDLTNFKDRRDFLRREIHDYGLFSRLLGVITE